MRVTCNDCHYTWIFTNRVRSIKLKRSYWVLCPSCGLNVFKRIKRKILNPISKNPTPQIIETTMSKEKRIEEK